MKISIITISYNSEATIAETIASVASQTYPNVEHIRGRWSFHGQNG